MRACLQILGQTEFERLAFTSVKIQTLEAQAIAGGPIGHERAEGTRRHSHTRNIHTQVTPTLSLAHTGDTHSHTYTLA